MLRKVLVDQYSNRTFIFGLICTLAVVFGGIMEYRDRQIDMIEYLGLAEFAGMSIMDAMLMIDPMQIIKVQFTIFILILKLLPDALFNASPVLIAWFGIPWLASRFIHTLYDTKNVEEARDFLDRNMLGMKDLNTIIIVMEGHIAVGAGSLYDQVGGRGLLIVYNDSAAVIERGNQLVHIAGPSVSFLSPFERVWETVDLRPQNWQLTVDAMTKEGISITCQADVTFKIDDRFVDEEGNVQTVPLIEMEALPITDEAIAGRLEGEGITEPFPYTEKAVFNAVTSTWVRIRQPDHPEQLRRWKGRLMTGEVERILRSILARYRLDWLLQPPDPGREHPREEIRGLLERELRSLLPVGNRIGARIISVDLGQIDIKDEKVSTQWLEAWQAGWKQVTAASQEEQDAELARLQAAQARAEANIVLTFTEAIRPLVTAGEEHSPDALGARFVETLWWTSYAPWMRASLPPKAMQTLKELESLLNESNEHLDGAI